MASQVGVFSETSNYLVTLGLLTFWGFSFLSVHGDNLDFPPGCRDVSIRE